MEWGWAPRRSRGGTRARRSWHQRAQGSRARVPARVVTCAPSTPTPERAREILSHVIAAGPQFDLGTESEPKSSTERRSGGASVDSRALVVELALDAERLEHVAGRVEARCAGDRSRERRL